jgi:NADP-reducing hydrogenase subunit HndB
MAKLTRETLAALAGTKTVRNAGPYIKVGMSSCGIAAGARVVFDFLKQEVAKRYPAIVVGQCGCNGLCFAEPLVEVCVDGVPPVVYGRVTPDIAQRIVEEHLGEGRLINDHIYVMAVKGAGQQ